MKTGIDIVEVKRIKRHISKKNFILKVFSDREINYCEKFKNKAERYSAKFAAKEAVIKAFKSDNNDFNFNLRDIEILNNENGAPYVFIDGLKIKGSLSVSHTSSYALAVFILEKYYEDDKDR
jgi:holo-[acyl-carrier protein] synthase